MPYLDALTRASKSPATDFHLCLLYYPSKHNEIHRFFTQELASDLWLRMKTLDIKLSNFEHKFSLKSEIVYQLHLTGQKPQDSELIENFDEWAETYQLWKTCQKDYSNKFGKFRLETIDREENVDEVELELTRLPIGNRDVAQGSKEASSEQNGVNFLMSIAGMFDSSTNDTSENVRVVVSDFISRKHGKIRNGSAH